MVESTIKRRSLEDLPVQRDWRADGGARRVRVTRSDILIARRFGGIDMRIQVPVPAYRGVFLDVVASADGAPCYRLLLAHPDRDLDVVLEETQDSAAAAADWRYWAAWLGVPQLAADDGEVAETGTARPAETPVADCGAFAVRRRLPAVPLAPPDRRDRAVGGALRRRAQNRQLRVRPMLTTCP